MHGSVMGGMDESMMGGIHENMMGTGMGGMHNGMGIDAHLAAALGTHGMGGHGYGSKLAKIAH